MKNFTNIVFGVFALITISIVLMSFSTIDKTKEEQAVTITTLVNEEFNNIQKESSVLIESANMINENNEVARSQEANNTTPNSLYGKGNESEQVRRNQECNHSAAMSSSLKVASIIILLGLWFFCMAMGFVSQINTESAW